MMILERRKVMAKSPSESGDHGHHDRNSPSPGGGATFAVEIALTSGASSHAARQGLSGALQAMRLPARCAAGDLVTLEAGGARHDFVVMRRRWLAGAGAVRLEITLDHPARPSTR